MRTLQCVSVEVGVRELRENLSEWLDRAAAGEDVIVTEEGHAEGSPRPRLAASTSSSSSSARGARDRRLVPAVRSPPPPPVDGSPATDALLRPPAGKGLLTLYFDAFAVDQALRRRGGAPTGCASCGRWTSPLVTSWISFAETSAAIGFGGNCHGLALTSIHGLGAALRSLARSGSPSDAAG